MLLRSCRRVLSLPPPLRPPPMLLMKRFGPSLGVDARRVTFKRQNRRVQPTRSRPELMTLMTIQAKASQLP